MDAGEKLLPRYQIQDIPVKTLFRPDGVIPAENRIHLISWDFKALQSSFCSGSDENVTPVEAFPVRNSVL